MVKRPAPPPDVAIDVLIEFAGNETSPKPAPAVAVCAPLKPERLEQVVPCCATGCDVGVLPTAVVALVVGFSFCADVVDAPNEQAPSTSANTMRPTRERDHRGKDGIGTDAS